MEAIASITSVNCESWNSRFNHLVELPEPSVWTTEGPGNVILLHYTRDRPPVKQVKHNTGVAVLASQSAATYGYSIHWRSTESRLQDNPSPPMMIYLKDRLIISDTLLLVYWTVLMVWCFYFDILNMFVIWSHFLCIIIDFDCSVSIFFWNF